MRTKTLLVTGLTGLVGTRAAVPLLRAGWRLRAVTRDSAAAQQKLPLPIEWFGPDDLKRALQGADAVLHLAGEPVAGKRWTAARKAAIRSSRVEGTRALVDAMGAMRRPPKVFVAASAVGIYGDAGEHELGDLRAKPGQAPVAGGNQFLRDTCLEWEHAWSAHLPKSTRAVGLRIGVVLAQEGGALAELLPIFKAGLGGPLAGGKPWMPWIHVDDLVALIVTALGDARYQGVFNAVAPEIVRNGRFTQVLGALLNRPAIAPVPTAALRLLYGEMADIVLASQRVVPQKALKAGFVFSYPSLEAALSAELIFEGWKGVNVLDSYQWFSRPLKQVLPFFSDAKNLEALTPPFLKFKVLSADTTRIRTGSLIDYQLNLHGLPVRWRTLISQWQPQGSQPFFKDVQLKGPYALWHHTHQFESLQGGTLMRDTVRFKLPFGWFGQWVEALVKMDVTKIFSFRVKAAAGLFDYS